MASLITRTITGQVALPNGVDPLNSRVRFVLSGYDTDSAESITLIPDMVDADINEDGAISIGLWPTEDGTRDGYYTVSVITKKASKDEVSFQIGRIVVPSGESALDLSTLMDAFAATAGEDWGFVNEPVTNFADYGQL